jgi:hypothetical protein
MKQNINHPKKKPPNITSKIRSPENAKGLNFAPSTSPSHKHQSFGRWRLAVNGLEDDYHQAISKAFRYLTREVVYIFHPKMRP